MKLRFFPLSLSLAFLAAPGASAQAPTGYASVAMQSGFHFVTNPFYGVSNKVARFIPLAAEGMELYKFSDGKFSTNTFTSGAWTNPDETLGPGEGAVIFNPTTKRITATFTGELPQGSLRNTIPAGLSLKSSLVPQSGRISTDLGLNLSPFDNVYQWRTNRYEVFTFLPDGTWIPSEPMVSVAQALFIRANLEVAWVRTFKINQ